MFKYKFFMLALIFYVTVGLSAALTYKSNVNNICKSPEHIKPMESDISNKSMGRLFFWPIDFLAGGFTELYYYKPTNNLCGLKIQ